MKEKANDRRLESVDIRGYRVFFDFGVYGKTEVQLSSRVKLSDSQVEVLGRAQNKDDLETLMVYLETDKGRLCFKAETRGQTEDSRYNLVITYFML